MVGKKERNMDGILRLTILMVMLYVGRRKMTNIRKDKWVLNKISLINYRVINQGGRTSGPVFLNRMVIIEILVL